MAGLKQKVAQLFAGPLGASIVAMSPRTMLDLNPALAMGKPTFQPRIPTPLAATPPPPVSSAGGMTASGIGTTSATGATSAPQPATPLPSIAVSTTASVGKDLGISTTTTTAQETSKKAFL